MKNRLLDIVIWLIIIPISIFMSTCQNKPELKDGYTELRKKMVREQIEKRGVNDSLVLNAMLKVQRHLFVPNDYQSLAYTDQPLSMGYGQTISQPYIVAFMTDILELHRSSKVLEIGTGSGYQAAILGELCDSVYSIELIEPLGRQAENILKELGYKNIFVKIGDGYKGWDQHAPYDAIIVTCAPEKIPESLKIQLAEGGRMIIPVGNSNSQELVLIKKRNGKFYYQNVLPVRFVPMIKQVDSY